MTTLCQQLARNPARDAALALVQQLAQSQSAAASACVAQALQAGQEDVVADRMIDALGELGARESLQALQRFTRHRRPQARAHAYLALSRLHEPAALSLVEQGLRDHDPSVRAQTARALAERGDPSAVPALLRALARSEPETAAAIGKLGDAASVRAFTAQLGNQPLEVMLTGYQRYLERTDLDRNTKLQIVATLEDVTGEHVRAFLQGLLTKPSIAGDEALTRALRGSVERLRTPVASPRKEPAR